MGLAVQRICVWCLAIVAIFTGFGQARAKRCGRCLKVINWEWRCKSQKGAGALFIGKASSHCVILLYCEVILQVLLGIYCKRFSWILSFHYTTVVLRVWGWQSQNCNSKCPNETLNGLFQKNFQTFYFTLENSSSLNLPPSPCLFFFSL